MNTLVIIPSLHHKYSFSAPLSWLFSEHPSKVRGIYSEDLCPKDLWGIDLCIVELNWFVELYEFALIIAFIRKHRRKCQILFGGLFGQLKYREIFSRYDVDYFIKGFAERPIKLLLDGQDPKTIPNLVGRDFENATTYVPSESDLAAIRYDLAWFPDYFRYWSLFPAPGIDMELPTASLPLYPSYRYTVDPADPTKEFRVPPRGGRYHLPMIVTARGTCRAVHDGCSYCMGSKKQRLKEIYGCDGVVLSNEVLKQHLRQLAKDFDQATLYINSPCEYDFTGEHYDLEVTIEFDCRVTPERLRTILYAFRKASVHMVLYRDGHQDRPGSPEVVDVQRFLELEDEHHRIFFFAFRDDGHAVGLTKKNWLYAEFVFPEWTSWEFYGDWDKAMKFSKRWFAFTRQYNLLPFPRKIIMPLFVTAAFALIYLASRLGIKSSKEEMLFGKTA